MWATETRDGGTETSSRATTCPEGFSITSEITPFRGRVAITGVTGLAGQQLAPRLKADGATVIGVSRSAARARGKVPALSDAIRWGGADAAFEEGAFHGLDAVVHLAGEPVSGRWTRDKKRRIERSRVEGTRRVVDAIERAETPPKVLISASAMGIYGDRGETAVTEEEPYGDDFLARVCKGWEREAQRAESLGVRVVRMRIGLVLSPDGGALGSMLPIFKGGIGGRLGSGTQWWSWIHLEDLVAFIARALADERMEGAYNVVSPDPIRQIDFAKTLGGVLGRPTVLPTPGLVLKTVLGGFAVEVLGSRRILPQRMTASGFHFRFTDLDAALRDLLEAPSPG
ncbi:MAG: TIGR01777 family oxidoreductase [Sandaracinaceae bacterium]